MYFYVLVFFFEVLKWKMFKLLSSVIMDHASIVIQCKNLKCEQIYT